MTPEQFKQTKSEGYTHIPVMREVLADLDTPLSTYIKLASGPYSYLFESVQGGEKWGRYSIIGLPTRTVIKVYDKLVSVNVNGKVIHQEQVEDPLAWLESYQAGFKVAEIEGLPRFSGGLVGYFDYDTIRYIETKLAKNPNPDTLNTPDILMMVSKEVVVFDNLAGKIFLVVHANVSEDNALAQAEHRLDEIVYKLRNEPVNYTVKSKAVQVHENDFVSEFTQEGFEDAVRKCKQYIVDGDVMQVVLSQRMSIDFKADALDLYRALRSLNPSPYMYYLELDDFQIVGSSPEILTRLEDNIVTVRPIAGTRPRGDTEKEDDALEQELLADPKELAEHLMLIDLGRNDVGRVAEIGSVELTEKMNVERYSHVMHIVSNVIGQLKPELSAMDVLRATFPAGTVSGAPKIRAMEIIDELESVKRGIYAGAIGYLSWSGNMDTAIAIRTAVIKEGKLTIQAGAGIVHDSIPEMEWQETMNKGRAIFRAVALAEAGLDAVHSKEDL